MEEEALSVPVRNCLDWGNLRQGGILLIVNITTPFTGNH